MPYEIVAVEGGEKVKNTETGAFASTRPLPHATALAQFRVLEGLEHGWSPGREGDGKDHPDDTG